MHGSNQEKSNKGTYLPKDRISGELMGGDVCEGSTQNTKLEI